MEKAFFFDMDGVLVNSIPRHAAAWAEIMPKYGLPMTERDCYLGEGQTGHDTIRQFMLQYKHREPTLQEMDTIYRDKCEAFERRGGAEPMLGVDKVLRYLKGQGNQIWVVTGSAMHSIIDKLNVFFSDIFLPERMITAEHYEHGKPDPEPYLKAWKGCGLDKRQCFVIENAPLGVRSGKAAGLTVYAVNTGILQREDLAVEGADCVFDDMEQLLQYVQQHH